MDFSITDVVVPDWRQSDAPARPMSEQVWEVLESLGSSDRIAGLMQGIKLVDQQTRPDALIDAGEWDLACVAMRRALGSGPRAAAPTTTGPELPTGEALYSAFELVLEQSRPAAAETEPRRR